MSLGILAWVLAGVITICAGLTVAELAASIPEVGGMVVWIENIWENSCLSSWMGAINYLLSCNDSCASCYIFYSSS